MPITLKRSLFFLVIVTIAWSVAMTVEANGIASVDFQQPAPNCYASHKPILDVELAANSVCFARVIAQGSPSSVERNV